MDLLEKKQLEERRLMERRRWYILQAIDAARTAPGKGVPHTTIELALDNTPYAISKRELLRELDYLHARQLVDVEERNGLFEAHLTRLGIDIVQYTVECDPGIDRPEKG